MSDYTAFAITIVFGIGAAGIVFVGQTWRGLSSPHSERAGKPASTSFRHADRVFGLLALAYFLLFSTLAILRYLSFTTGDVFIDASFDLGHYDQIVWNSLHGRLFENSFIPDAPNFLGKSFTPILLALVPLYAVWSDPIVLLVLQTLALTVAAFPIYWFARQKIGSAGALVIGAAYYLFPAVQNVNLNEFHEIAFAAPLLAFLMFFLLRGHMRGFWACLLLSLLVKEEFAFITIALGVFIALVQRRVWLGLALVAFGSVWAVALLQWIIPFFGDVGRSAFYYFESGEIAGGAARYAWLGSSLGEIAQTILTRPQLVIANVLAPEKIAYVLHLLLPLGLLSLVGAEFLILTLPTFGYTLLSTFPPQYSIHFSYSPPLIAFIFFAGIVGWARFRQMARRVRQASRQRAIEGAIGALVLTTAIGSNVFHAAGPFAQYFQAERYKVNTHTLLGDELTRAIPSDAVVATQWDMLAHLSNRRYVYEISHLPHFLQADYLVADTTLSWYAVHKGLWERYLATGYFAVETRDGWLIAARKPPEKILNARVNEQFAAIGYTLGVAEPIRGGSTIRPIVFWRADQAISARYKFIARVVDARGHVWAEIEQEPQEGALPTRQWQVGKLIGDQYALRLPPTMPTGEYEITLSARGASEEESEVPLTTIRVEKNKASFTASGLAKEQPLVALFVDMQELRFLGFAPPRQTISAGELLQVGLYWRAREKPCGDYVVAVQVRDASGRIAAEEVNRPANGTYPTTQWDAGEVLLDWHDFSLPASLASGAYQIVVVLRDVSGKELGSANISPLIITK